MTNVMRAQGRRAIVVGGVAAALLLGSPMAQAADAATARGNTYGGVTSQGMPVVVDMTATRRLAVRVVAAVRMTCSAGGTWTVPDRFARLSVTKGGKFRIVYGPVTQRNDDGTTTDYQGRVTGALNDAKTKLTGTWRLIATDHDATGAVTDHCDTGLLTWKAKQ
jgi:hypothetical protein